MRDIYDAAVAQATALHAPGTTEWDRLVLARLRLERDELQGYIDSIPDPDRKGGYHTPMYGVTINTLTGKLTQRDVDYLRDELAKGHKRTHSEDE